MSPSPASRAALQPAKTPTAPSAEALPASIYNELRQLARGYLRRESQGHTLQPTALVHEAYLRMAGQDFLARCGKTHVRALFAQAMHRILVDHARSKATQMRGGQRVRLALDEQLVPAGAEQDLLDLLERLHGLDAQQGRLVELRIFGGLTVAEAAEELGVSKRTAEREWTAARAWLRRELAAATDA
jgi:RNA polymerase sigma factor (TIGR02999 family)